MRHHIFVIAAALLVSLGANAQKQDKNSQQEYRRSSIYSVLISHSEQNYASEIQKAFLDMPVPERYNDHNLSIKVLDMDKKLKGARSDDENGVITTFLNDNLVASRLVGKWFDRDVQTGQCDMELVKFRGLYAANTFDEIMAEKSSRREALLMDAGEDLIGNTFVLVNDIRYIDKAKKSQGFGMALRILGAVAGQMAGVDLSDATDLVASSVESIKGFKVRVNTFLYQLQWNKEVADEFYSQSYTEDPDEAKRQYFESNRGNFQLKYVGKVESAGNNTSFLGVNLDEPYNMVRKACQRALDENVADLAHDFEAFRTKVPLVSVAPLQAYVGMKEGITKDSKFEVLEIVEKEDGTRQYKRVGVIKPEPTLIWDNRYMAKEEGAANSTLGATTFKKVSGGELFPGMLIREID